MEAAKKSCGFAVTLTFIVAVLMSLTLLMTFNSDELWEFRHKILGINETIDSDKHVMSPNLTSCHQSYGRDDLLVYCCPPENPQHLKFIDFKFPQPLQPLRVRKPAHLLDEDYKSKYSRAVSIMKSLPYSDPRSFSRQADLHCIFCTGAYDQKYSNISLNIHRAWFFFPWHRMMLHFHERILGSLIGDDTFALPFWNWDSPEGMTIPELYMNEPLDHQVRDASHFPPRVADIDFVDKESGLGPQEQTEKNLAMMYNQLVSGAKKTELFMGCSYYPGEGGTCDGPGTLELAPHNTLHSWVGSSFNPSREDMGAFYSAARDPLFYAHHSNIDRMWEVWREIHGKILPISDPAWLGSYFYFYDENSQLVRIKVGDVLHLSKLRYAYEEVDLPWLNKSPKPSVSPEIARQVLKMRDTSGSRFLYAEFGGNARNLEASMTVKVYRPKYQRTKKEKEEEEEVLIVYGIDVESNLYVKFDVYVNVADEKKIDPGFREFAGTFVRLPQARNAEIGSRKSTLKLGISELIDDLEADGDESIWVTILPRTISCMNTTIDGIRIEFMR